jgi:chorismate synthase
MSLRFLTAGESHGPALVAILEGMPAGLPISMDGIQRDLARRQKGFGAGPRMKIEKDVVRILAGVMNGQTIGSPIAILIENRDHAKWGGKRIAPFTIPRPGHADLSAMIKYGYTDLRPGLERASARETAARVAIGSICRQFLERFDIVVQGYVCSIAEVEANLKDIPLPERFQRSLQNDVNCPDWEAAMHMHHRIQKAMQERQTLGGIIEVVALGVPPGLGSHVHWDRRLDARLGAAVLSIQAIKGVEIGPAFENTRLNGSQAQDPICIDEGNLNRPSNRCGGLEGGITTGQPLIVRAAMKPIATTLTPQESVDLATGEPTHTQYERSDFCPVPRAVVIVEAMIAFVLADALLEKLGGDSMQEMMPRYALLRKARLSDIHLEKSEHIYWSEEE